MTGQPVTAAIVVARFHRPPFLIRAVSILFTFAEKVCALSWFKERKEFYFYTALLQRENSPQITSFLRRERERESFVLLCRSFCDF